MNNQLTNKEIYLTKAEVSTAVKSLKAGKAPGKDDIKSKMLKAMNNLGVFWMTRVFQVAWKAGEISKQWQTSVLISIYKKQEEKKCTN